MIACLTPKYIIFHMCLLLLQVVIACLTPKYIIFHLCLLLLQVVIACLTPKYIISHLCWLCLLLLQVVIACLTPKYIIFHLCLLLLQVVIACLTPKYIIFHLCLLLLQVVIACLTPKYIIFHLCLLLLQVVIACLTPKYIISHLCWLCLLLLQVVIACLTPKYIISHLCNKELSLADLLRKPIIPVMYSKVPWPPPGGMALTLSQLVYINMKGVGGHGGSGIHADKEDKYQEILQRVTAHAVAKPRPQLDLSPRSEMPKKSDSCHSEPSLPSDVYDGEGAAESFIPYISDSSISGRTTYTAALHGPQNNTPNTAAIARSEFNPHHGNQVEQVHVTKCAVCVIL